MSLSNFFRNPEVRRAALLYAGLTVFASAAGLSLDWRCGALTLAVCLLFGVLRFSAVYRHYRQMAELARRIDAVLHGEDALGFDGCGEGELAILQSEVRKMTLRLLEQRDALEADKRKLTDSIADISHQLRTPLTSINILVSFLSKPELTPQRRLELARELERLCDRIDWLISSLLKLSRLDAGTANLTRRPVLLSEVVRRAAEPLLIPMELRELSFDLSADGTESFTGDLSWTVEAVSNILKNCMEHTPPGGSVSAACSENAVYTELVVRDTGSGIDPDDLPHLFERFYKGKNAGAQSVGIGLALARQIVSEQNGVVKAENTGSGSKFTIRFYKGII